MFDKIKQVSLGVAALTGAAVITVGHLLGLATGFHEPAESTRHRGQLARQILRRIESDYADAELSPEAVAAEIGISKRYLQTLLAGSGTSFE